MTLDELKQVLDQTVQKNGKNSFYIVKVAGRFESIQVRSEYAQQKPYLPLDQVMETDQVIFNDSNVSGTVIGLYCPDYMDKLNTPGWHFHFLSDGATQGGHVLSLIMKEGTVSYDRTDQFLMVLPTHSAFQSLDLAVDLSEAIQQAETNA